MAKVLTGVCVFCKNKRESIYGEYCKFASYTDNIDGYGEFWKNNDCKHDQHHRFKNLFEPIQQSEQTKLIESLKDELEFVHKEKNALSSENSKLRSLIK